MYLLVTRRSFCEVTPTCSDKNRRNFCSSPCYWFIKWSYADHAIGFNDRLSLNQNFEGNENIFFSSWFLHKMSCSAHLKIDSINEIFIKEIRYHFNVPIGI
jgi:hypothetical protein